MQRLIPLKSGEVIKKLRKIGFSGPFPGGKHIRMVNSRISEIYKEIWRYDEGSSEIIDNNLRWEEVLGMLKIRKEYIITDDNQKKAVLIDIETFKKIEEILEDYGLGKYMKEVEEEEPLSMEDAKKYYHTLKKD